MVDMRFSLWLESKMDKNEIFKMIDNNPVEIVNHTNKSFERFMALIRGKNNHIYLRCVLSKRDSIGNFPNSYLCEGRLIGNTIHVDKILLSPEIRPKTENDEEVVGYEDPSLLSDGTLLVVEAYNKDRRIKRIWSEGVWTNLISYNPKTNKVKTVLRPEKAKRDLGLRQADMVKEAHVFDFDGKSYMLFEVSGEGYSRIVIANYDGGKIGKIMPFLHPIPKTWLSEHTSTACSPIRLGDNYIFLFNGRDKKKWAIGFGLMNSLGHLYYLSPTPIIGPPNSSGWGGQRISFASDVTKKGNMFEVFYHINDNSIHKATFEVKVA